MNKTASLITELSSPELTPDFLGETLRDYIFDSNESWDYDYVPRSEIDARYLGKDELYQALFNVGAFPENPDPNDVNEVIAIANGILVELDNGLAIIATWFADGDMQLHFNVSSPSGETVILINNDAKKKTAWYHLEESLVQL